MAAVEFIDIGVVFVGDIDRKSFAQFAGAIHAAERLGYHVDIVTIRDNAMPIEHVHSLVARAYWIEPGVAKAR